MWASGILLMWDFLWLVDLHLWWLSDRWTGSGRIVWTGPPSFSLPSSKTSFSSELFTQETSVHRRTVEKHRITVWPFKMLRVQCSMFGRWEKQDGHRMVSGDSTNTWLEVLSLRWERYQCSMWHHKGHRDSNSLRLIPISPGRFRAVKWLKDSSWVVSGYFLRVHTASALRELLTIHGVAT